jgi:Tfp pilus assembly protein PilF
MKRLFIFLILCLLALSPGARAEGVDDQYIVIYNIIQQGDALSEKGQAQTAIAKYLEAQTALRKFQAANQDWNTKVVKFRLNYLANRITQLSSNVPATPPVKLPAPARTNSIAPPAAPTNTPTVIPAPSANEAPAAAPTKAAAPAESSEAEVKANQLQEQVRRLEADKVLLEAKLKEALSAQPASVDPRELAKSQDRLKELERENDLLKVSLEQARTNALADPAVMEQARKQLEEANKKVAQLTDANKMLSAENQSLLARAKSVSTADEATTALREENEILKKEVAQLRSKGGSPAKGEDLNRQLLQAQAQVAALQSDKDILRLEKIALENRLKQVTANAALATANPAATPGDAAGVEKIKLLESQRDELQKSLDATTKELRGHKKGKETAARIDEMTKELATLRARVNVLEARQVPYSEQELALFKQPRNMLVASVATAGNGGKKARKELPASARGLITEAQKLFSEHEFAKAEEKYKEVLKLDDKNVFTLGNLAAIQMEMNQLDEAETNLKQALALEPDDAFSLSLMGRLKFQQAKYDEALDLLSRAAVLDPQNAEVQNYLGITLSHQGLRGPAETALRKAIQLDPGYGSAHNNLAVVYATQRPPLLELARWHYEKALSTGHPKNPELEKMLDATKTAAAIQ